MRDALLSDFWFPRFKIVNKGMMDLFKGNEDFGFPNFIWLDSKV